MTPAQLAACQAPQLAPAIFVQLTFASTTIYVWSGLGSILWNGQTWMGLGALLGLAPVEEGTTVEARGMTVRLSGIDPALLPECLGDFQLGLPAVIYFDVYANGALTGSPLTAWSGRMDQPTLDVAADTATIAIACESRLVDLNIAVDRRYTLEDQQMDWPGDLGFVFTAGLQEQALFWGNYPNTSNNI